MVALPHRPQHGADTERSFSLRRCDLWLRPGKGCLQRTGPQYRGDTLWGLGMQWHGDVGLDELALSWLPLPGDTGPEACERESSFLSVSFKSQERATLLRSTICALKALSINCLNY